MFKRTINTLRPTTDQHFVIKVVDTDFEDEFMWDMKDNMRSYWDGIVEVYERNGANIASNLLLALNWMGQNHYGRRCNVYE